jgi:hypothetical protein
MRNRVVFVIVLFALLGLVLLGCTMGGGSARVTPTPTKTPRPIFTATMTPTESPAPTDTPVPTNTPIPTDTPVPPTDTPVSEATPTDTPVPAPTDAPPTETPIPTDTPVPAPTNTSAPKPTNTPASPTNTPKPAVDFRVVEQRLMAKSENEAQRHMVLLRVIDAGGNPLAGLTIWDPSHPDQEVVSGSKPEPYHAEYLFWNYDGYQLEIKGANSEKTKIISTDVHRISIEDLVAAGYCTDASHCNPDELVQHFSWYVTFQRTW